MKDFLLSLGNMKGLDTAGAWSSRKVGVGIDYGNLSNRLRIFSLVLIPTQKNPELTTHASHFNDHLHHPTHPSPRYHTLLSRPNHSSPPRRPIPYAQSPALLHISRTFIPRISRTFIPRPSRTDTHNRYFRPNARLHHWPSGT